MKTSRCIPFLAAFLAACAPGTYLEHELAADGVAAVAPEPSVSDTGATTPAFTPVTDVAEVRLSSETLVLKPGQRARLTAEVSFDNGSTYAKVASRLTTAYGHDLALQWFANDDSIVAIGAEGYLEALEEGSTTVKVSVANRSAIATVVVSDAATLFEATSLAFHQLYAKTSETRSRQLTFDVGLDGVGVVANVTADTVRTLTGLSPDLASSDPEVASIDADAVFTPRADGETVFTAACGGLVAEFPLAVTGLETSDGDGSDDAPDAAPADTNDADDGDAGDEGDDETADGSPDETGTTDDEDESGTAIVPEEPLDGSGGFLAADDDFTLTVGEDGGFGESSFPDVIFGAPQASRTDVVSFGKGGGLTITLNGFVIVDGEGADFTVFENAFTGWVEPAYVSVSEDGINYYPYSCDPADPEGVHAGCAGVTPVEYSSDSGDYFETALSGGDSYDLAGTGLTRAKYVRLTDADVCDNPVVCVPNTAGFDLDALAVVNGENE